MCVSLPDVALNLKPVSSITHCTCSKAISSQVKLDCSIIQSTQRNRYKTRYVLPAIMGPSPNSRGSCIPRLPEKYLPPLGVVDCSSVGKKTTWVATSNHGLDLEVISRHLLAMSSHWKTRELNNWTSQSTTNRKERCDVIQLMAAQQRFQPLAKLNPDPKLR